MSNSVQTSGNSPGTSLTLVQHRILEFAKETNFTGTLRDFVKSNKIDPNKALAELKQLKQKRFISMGAQLLDSPITLTSNGLRIMGYTK